MAELSTRTGVPIPTIKFYLREGLLPAGRRTSPNQAQYDDHHIRRLRLIRALVDVGGLPIARARSVLNELDGPEQDLLESLGKVQYSLLPRQERTDDAQHRAARDRVRDLLHRQGWRVRPDNPALGTLADVVAVLDRLDQQDVLDLLDTYARAAHDLAGTEVDVVQHRAPLEERAEGVVVLAVLGDALLVALRRLAQEDVVVRRLGGEGPAPDAARRDPAEHPAGSGSATPP